MEAIELCCVRNSLLISRNPEDVYTYQDILLQRDHRHLLCFFKTYLTFTTFPLSQSLCLFLFSGNKT